MNWMTSFVLMAVIGGAHLQCFTPNDNFQKANFSTDLSGITDFSLDLFKQLWPEQSQGNFFFSPYSIWNALMLAYFGSAGNTQTQLETALRVSDKVSTIKLWKALEKLYESRKQSNLQYTFDLANRAYFRDSVQLRSCIQDVLQNELRTISSDLSASVTDINKFVSETTRGRISEIVTEGDIAAAIMVLVNAVYFKGTWKYQFEPSFTHQRDFFINSSESSPVEMMSQEGSFNYAVSTQLGARVLELPYAGETMSMYILLPSPDRPAETRFADMVNSLSGTALREAINLRQMRVIDIEVQLPKFKMEKKIEDELPQALMNLGITDLFDAAKANMTTFSPYGGLSIDRAIHKAFIEVNEEGTEAAAATVLTFRSSLVEQSRPLEFHCNEPFVYIIYDRQTNNVLFVGAFKDPRSFSKER